GRLGGTGPVGERALHPVEPLGLEPEENRKLRRRRGTAGHQQTQNRQMETHRSDPPVGRREEFFTYYASKEEDPRGSGLEWGEDRRFAIFLFPPGPGRKRECQSGDPRRTPNPASPPGANLPSRRNTVFSIRRRFHISTILRLSPPCPVRYP